jgi:hypothetical protein
MLEMLLLLLLEVVNQEFHRWLETIEGYLVPFGLKSYLFERQEEGIDVP